MRHPSTQIATVLRLVGSATLAVLLALPAVGLICPPEMGEFCPLQAAQECSMGSGEMHGETRHDGHEMSAHGGAAMDTATSKIVQAEHTPMSCCIGTEAPAPVSQAVLSSAPDTLVAPPAAPYLAASILAPAPARPGPVPEIRALSTPLYTLHSILLS